MADYQVKGKMTLDSGSFISSATSASNSLNGLNTSATKTNNAMKHLKRGLLAAGAALGGLGLAGVKAASDFQQAQIAFTTMLGSAEKATTFLQDMREFAAKTPFELPELLSGARRLLAFGFAADEILPMLQNVGDAAAGLGIGGEGVDRITLALGKMNSKGKVSAEELNQLAEAGVPALQYLADAAGVTKAEILKMSERGMIPGAEAVDVLVASMGAGSANAMGFAGAMEGQSKTMAGLMSTLKDTARDAFVDGFGKYVPAIGGSFEGLIPKVGGVVQGLVTAMAFLITNVGKLAGAFMKVLAPVFTGFVVPVLKVVVGIVAVLLAVMGKLGDFISSNIGVFQTLAVVIGMVALAYGGLIVGAKIHMGITKAQIALSKLHALFMKRQAIATTFLTKAQRLLNLTMAFNPIGLILAAVVALTAGFMILWNKSNTFREMIINIGKVGLKAIGFLIEMVGKLAVGYIKIVTGPMRLLLKGLELLGVSAAGKVLDGFDGMTEGIGNFFDGVAKKVADSGASLDKFAKMKIKPPTFGKDEKAEVAVVPKLVLGGADSKGGAAAIKKDLAGVLLAYNDYIKNDFAPGFMKDSDTARDTVVRGLDELKKVFDEQAKGLKGAALTNLTKAYDAVNSKIRAFLADAESTGKAIEAVSEKLDNANDVLKNAIAARKDGIASFVDTLRTPFGEPSDMAKALSNGEANVDSIIGMYDKMVDAVNKRFEGMDTGKRDQLISFLTDQTAALVGLAKKREAAVKALEEANSALEDVLSRQKEFQASIASSLKDFGQAMADVSKADSDNTIKVIKTASGLVLTQISKGTTGVDAVTKQLRDRLATIRSFTANIQSLLAKGLNKTYVEQLLSAGPEAAGQTAALLATSGADQVASINDLYSQIGTASEVFGKSMADTFYGNSVDMAKALVKGASDEEASITAKMLSIRQSIEKQLNPLASLGTNLGTDLAQGLVDSLEASRATLVAKATSIAAAISAAMAGALSGIGVSGGAVIAQPKAPVVSPPPATPIPNFNPSTNPLSGITQPRAGQQGFIGPVPIINVTINKNVEDKAMEDILLRTYTAAMRAR